MIAEIRLPLDRVTFRLTMPVAAEEAATIRAQVLQEVGAQFDAAVAQAATDFAAQLFDAPDGWD